MSNKRSGALEPVQGGSGRQPRVLRVRFQEVRERLDGQVAEAPHERVVSAPAWLTVLYQVNDVNNGAGCLKFQRGEKSVWLTKKTLILCSFLFFHPSISLSSILDLESREQGNRTKNIYCVC
jgi:hypothetical protein